MPSAMSGPMSLADWSRLLLLAAVWGCTFFLVAVAQRDLPPMTLVALRVGIAALALHLWLKLSGRRPPAGARARGQFLAMGFLNNHLPFALIFWAQTHIASGLAAILNAATPIFAMVLAHLWTRDDRLSAGRAVGVLTGFMGVAVMVGLEALRGISAGLLGQLAVLGAAMSYACAGIYGRRLRGFPPAAAACGQLSGSAALALPLALLIDRPWTLPAPDGASVAAVLALGLLGTALGYVVYFRILAASGAVNLLLVTLLLPAVAVLLGAGLLDERLEPRQVAGMALIALGLAVIDGRLLRLRPARPAGGTS
ncbi:MAG: DMT family transporter [Rhodospirillales bacterium]